ncbi:MAG: ornithine cyclodeaminase family protein [Gammaproteobacteria bacterium]|nr:ornithine cyclodeaminase family protein [Gammaproteobacteria bacterium]
MNAPFLDSETVFRNLDMPGCIDLMAATQAAISRGDIELPLRSMLPIADGAGHFGVMPGEIGASGVFGAKLVTLFPENPARGIPNVQGYILLFNQTDGTPLALVEASSVTALRTAAASGAATRLLAREDASVLAVLGCGVLAATHLEAMLAARPVRDVRIWGRNFEKATAFAERHPDQGGARVRAVADAAEAVADADLVCTVTGSHTPILEGGWLSPGAHVNLVGAHSPATREADGVVLGRGRVYTEITEFALAEAGDLLLAIEEGLFARSDIVGEIGQAIDGGIPGRTSNNEITVYKSLGNIAQDLAAAHFIYTRVTRQTPG